MNSPSSRKELRKRMRDVRRSLSATQQHDASRELCRRLVKHPSFIQAKAIACYLASDGEVSTWPILNLAQRKNKRIFLPVIRPGNKMEFHLYQGQRRLVKNKFDILEPHTSSPSIIPQQLDLILMPLVAFDASGNRLGMGGGYYDRALSFKRNGIRTAPILIGLAHSQQQSPALTPEVWDVSLDYIATEKKIFEI